MNHAAGCYFPKARAELVPIITASKLQKAEAFRQLALATTVIQSPEPSGDAFGIAHFRPDMPKEINATLERIKRDGTYDRINSRFLSLRVC